MKSKITHCIATCTVCGKEWQNYETARDSAREHSKRTGHLVIGEVAYAFSYRGRVKDEK